MTKPGLLAISADGVVVVCGGDESEKEVSFSFSTPPNRDQHPGLGPPCSPCPAARASRTTQTVCGDVLSLLSAKGPRFFLVMTGYGLRGWLIAVSITTAVVGRASHVHASVDCARLVAPLWPLTPVLQGLTNARMLAPTWTI